MLTCRMQNVFFFSIFSGNTGYWTLYLPCRDRYKIATPTSYLAPPPPTPSLKGIGSSRSSSRFEAAFSARACQAVRGRSTWRDRDWGEGVRREEEGEQRELGGKAAGGGEGSEGREAYSHRFWPDSRSFHLPIVHSWPLLWMDEYQKLSLHQLSDAEKNDNIHDGYVYIMKRKNAWFHSRVILGCDAFLKKRKNIKDK